MNATKTRPAAKATTFTGHVNLTRTFPLTTEARKIINRYLAYESMASIAELFRASIPAVRNLLVVNGVEIRGRGRVAGN